MSKQHSPVGIAVTRIANACVLLELDGNTILTDPWFTERWYLRRGEPLGLAIDEIPPVTAIVATSFAVNHWDLRALRRYPHKTTTPVFVSTRRMARQARKLGYPLAEQLRWDEIRTVAPQFSIEAVPAGKTFGWPNNAYAFTSASTRVFFGGEIREVGRLERYRARSGAAAVALLPVNGLKPLLGPPLVMGPREAVAGAKALGASTLIPIHDADGGPLSVVFRRHGSAQQAGSLAEGTTVVALPPGERWQQPSPPEKD